MLYLPKKLVGREVFRLYKLKTKSFLVFTTVYLIMNNTKCLYNCYYDYIPNLATS